MTAENSRADALTDERSAFELHAKREGLSLKKDKDGSYATWMTIRAWRAWLRRARIAASAQADYWRTAFEGAEAAMQPEAASISARWIAFADALPPIQDNGRGDTLRRKVLVTNNINARDAFGDPSHVWLGNPEHDKKHGWFVYDGGMFLTHWADPFTACVPTPSLADERTLVNEIFERQHAGFERCYEALGIADDRERSWSSLVMAINDALNARVEEADNETNYLRDTGRTIESVCGLPELEAGASEAVATLHDDGHYVWNPKVSKPDGYDRAGWKMPVYAAPQPTQADNQKGKK